MSSHLLGKYRGNSAHVNFFLDSAALTRRKLNSFPVAFKFFPFQNFMQYGKLFHISAMLSQAGLYSTKTASSSQQTINLFIGVQNNTK